jgi:hypothetical protein
MSSECVGTVWQTANSSPPASHRYSLLVVQKAAVAGLGDWLVNVKRLAYLGNDGGPIKIVEVFPDLVICNGGHGQDGVAAIITGSITSSIWQLGIRG